MTERRKWKAEEKLSIIKEIKEKGKVFETCRKYSVDPGMYYKWKESYDTFVLDDLKTYYMRIESKVRKLMKENEKLKVSMPVENFPKTPVNSFYFPLRKW